VDSRGGAILRREREQRGWSQADVANRIGAPSPFHVSRWERGVVVPSPRYRERYCRLFAKTAAELGFVAWTAETDGRLPVPQAPLVGRDAELAGARVLLGDQRVRMLTLTGPAGIGKTHLALVLAREQDGARGGGVGVVDMAPIQEPRLIACAIRRRLGVPRIGRRPATEDVAAHLRDRPFLLVLDNLEHLAAGAGQLSQMLRACPSLRLLVTSRTPLDVHEERQLIVPPLAVADAMTLFVERARVRSPDFAVTDDNAEVVAAICRRLGAIPLAIELAAQWIRLHAPRTLLELLDGADGR
jgi:transcriptional regulator with XRE-family HTH domain